MTTIFESNEITRAINDYILKLRLEKFPDDQAKAVETLNLLDPILSDENLNSMRSLIDALNSVETIIHSQMPWETTPCNIIHRVIKIVKDEYSTLRNLETNRHSPAKAADSSSGHSLEVEVNFTQLRNNVQDVLVEQMAELEQCQELISNQGETKIHSDEVIMTCDYCPTVLGFLLNAAKKRRFHVIVAEGAPKYHGQKMALELSAANIQTTVIQDAAIFPMMSRVNKVIIGCQTVFCNGGIKTFLGAAVLACAAKYYSVPLYVCSPTYKFSSEMMEEVVDFDSPSLVIPKGKADAFTNVNVAVAKFDYVHPENVTSFITNNRGIAPSYVYRQVMELYHPADDDI